MRLLSQENLVMQCLKLAEEGCGHPQNNVFLQSAKTFLQLVRYVYNKCEQGGYSDIVTKVLGA